MSSELTIRVAACTHQRYPYDYPLCDLQVLDHRSPNHDPVQISVVVVTLFLSAMGR